VRIIKEFRDFAIKGNVVDMAVGIIIGAAFTGVVTALVTHVMMPPIGYLTGGIDFADKRVRLADARYLVQGESVDKAAFDAAKAAGTVVREVPPVDLSWGLFLNASISFLITAFAVFMLVKAINRARVLAAREAAQAPPPEPPADVRLLSEIRDLLARR